ncbi:MAG: hypothetical protein ACQETQ_00045 [Spirochaetota bacterium]
MRVFVYGSSTVEHAVLWRLTAGSRIAGLFCADIGTSQLGLAKLLGGGREDPAELVSECRSRKVDVALLSPQEPGSIGLGTELRRAGITVIAPDEHTRRLETTPSSMQSFAAQYGIPTGKPDDTDVTVFALTDGRDVRSFSPCRRHVFTDRNGRGTAREIAGALTPVPWLDSSFLDRVQEEIIHRTVNALLDSKLHERGFLGFGIGGSNEGPVLSSMRFGFAEPEAALFMPLLDADFGALLEALAENRLASEPFRMSDRYALAFVLTNRSNAAIEFRNPALALPGFPGKNYAVFLSHAHKVRGEVSIEPGATVTAVGLGRDPLQARQRALTLAGELAQSGLSFRKDVGSNIFV